MITINATGPEGNAFAIMAVVQRLLRKQGKTRVEINAALNLMQTGDYDHLCKTAERVTNGELEVVK